MNKKSSSDAMDVSYSIRFEHTPSFIARTTFFYIQTSGHFKCRPHYITKREKYKSYLLLYSISGKGYLDYHGKHYEIMPNQIMFIDCYPYQTYYTDKNALWEMEWIHFCGGMSEEYFNIICDNWGPVVSLPQSNTVLSFIQKVMFLMEKCDIQFETKASCIITQALTEIILTAEGHFSNSEISCYANAVEASLEYIAKNFESHISLDDLASVNCFSKYHFIRIFKKATGFSPCEYLSKYRINKAKSILLTTDLPVESIALNVGFTSVSYFIKTFRQLEDMTPLKYRKLWEHTKGSISKDNNVD